jgi:hypothetical protein
MVEEISSTLGLMIAFFLTGIPCIKSSPRLLVLCRLVCPGGSPATELDTVVTNRSMVRRRTRLRGSLATRAMQKDAVDGFSGPGRQGLKNTTIDRTSD